MNGTGALTARLADDADKIQSLTTLSISSLVQLASSMAVAIGLAFYYSWQMTLVVLATLPAFALAGVLESQATWISANDPEVRKAYSVASQTACDAIANIRTVKSLTIEKELANQYKCKSESCL
jgi:ABC-type multidrug transport system fused ATPase/permease subunit